MGGPFPLHAEDCMHVRPDVVQELIAVQWALSYWNQNPKHAEYKLGKIKHEISDFVRLMW